MARELYNFIWTLPPHAIDHHGPTLVGGRGVVGRQRRWSRAVILFPNLMSPLIHVTNGDDQWLELLIVAPMELTPQMVNRQLRISAGLDPRKRHSYNFLFGGAEGRIEVAGSQLIDQRGRERFSTHSRFSGIIEARVAQALARRGFNRVHRVRVHQSGLPLQNDFDARDYSAQRRVLMRYRYRAEGGDTVGVTELGRVALEDSDRIVYETLHSLQGNPSIAGRGHYAFRAQGSTVDPMRADKEEPIQSYHPVFVYTDDDRFQYANIAHVSDIHINMRLQLLGKTKARVIEYGDGIQMAESPEISDLLQETNRSFSEVLSNLLASDADVLIVGGDLIDHFRNAYSHLLARPRNRPPSVVDIWGGVDMDHNYNDAAYPIGVDMIAFYSFIIRAMRMAQMPMLAISGNHDAYQDAYGISPRMVGQRPNEGIPADINLTYYEALLAFGPSSATIQSTANFTPRLLEWFYTVFTPFKDFSLKLPKQELVCLGWGEQEDLFRSLRDRDQGVVGHLPRSVDGVSRPQLALLNTSIGDSVRNTILCTHFTIASYADFVPMYVGASAGRVGRLHRGSRFERFQMGTFNDNRNAVLRHLKAGQIQVVLTGHSHRRGVYLLEDRRQWPLTVRMYDPHPTRGFDVAMHPRGVRPVPVIIVSDSAGPYPKHNRSGEFLGWAPDKPAGTLVRFDSTGSVRQVRAIRANRRAKPRAAVGLDYLDQIESSALTGEGIRTLPFLVQRHNRGYEGVLYKVRVPLHRVLHDYMSVYIRKVVFAGRRIGGSWVRVETSTWNTSERTWDIAAADNQDFRTLVNFALGERYIGIYAGTRNTYLSARFNWAQPWLFEVAVRSTETSGDPESRYLRFTRPSARMPEAFGPNVSYADIPNWNFRRRFGGAKYRPS